MKDKTINTGGTAFPVTTRTSTGYSEGYHDPYINPDAPSQTYKGMTLRDYFAAHAPEMPKEFGETIRRIEKNKDLYNEKGRVEHSELIAMWSYYHADAMLKEKENNG